MNTKLRVAMALLLGFLITVFGHQAKASHYIGSDLTYTCIAPGFYVVELRLYRDCTGAGAPTSASLNVKSLGCNTGRSQAMTKVGTNVTGTIYCAAIGNPCTTTARPNYEQVTFTTTVAFTAAEQNCQEWLLSWAECCRPESINLVNPSGQSLYAEAMLRMSANNSSPGFGPLNVPVFFVNHDQPIQISTHAYELEGDSLVYSIQNPLGAQNSPVAFAPFLATTVTNSNSTKISNLPAGTHSSSFPITSYAIDWSQPSPVTPVPFFMYDSKTGSMGFIPAVYYSGTNPAAGRNKYVMGVLIEEYRKVNGAPVKVGFVRRDMMIIVDNSAGNQNPKISSAVVNGQQITQNTLINLRPGTPLNFQFATIDGNATDVLTLSSDVTSVLNGATFSTTTANHPTGTITWTPTAADVRNLVYYFHINLMDDGCPLRSFQTHTFGVKVSATGGVTGTKEPVATSGFRAYPNPFSHEITFSFNRNSKAESLEIYNLLGQQVDQISIANLAAGEQNTKWQNAGKYAAGTYVAKLIGKDKTIETLKFTKLQ